MCLSYICINTVVCSIWRIFSTQEKYKKIIDTRDSESLEGLRGKTVPKSMKVTVTGHSLGGLVAYLVGNEDECYIYNMAR